MYMKLKGRPMNGRRQQLRGITFLLALGTLTACGGSHQKASTDSQTASAAAAAEGPTAQITPEARQQAQQIFSTRCAVCHGADGRGDGPGGTGLNPPPRNYHDTAWQDSVTDKEIESAIVYGGAAVGRSPGMIANPDLASKPAVVAALREIVRKFGKEK